MRTPHAARDSKMNRTEVQLILSAGGQFYAIPEVRRECGLWLSIAKHPLPVPTEWHRPGLSFAAVIRGRGYWRIGHHAPLHTDGSKAVSIDDELVRDYRDASWWTPGLEDAWAEATRRSEAEPSTPVEQSGTSKRVREVRLEERVCDVRTAERLKKVTGEKRGKR